MVRHESPRQDPLRMGGQGWPPRQELPELERPVQTIIMQLEAGKRYITRGGLTTSPLELREYEKTFKFFGSTKESGDLTWTEAGFYLNREAADKKSAHFWDLVAEYHEPEMIDRPGLDPK